MKTVNQLLDIALDIPAPHTKKTDRLIRNLRRLKITNGGLTKIKNSSDIMKAFALEKAGKINDISS